MAVDYTKLLDGNSLKAIKSYVDNTFLKNYGSNPQSPGATITQPAGSNAVSMRSGATSGRDIGIFRLSDDNAYICNSSDNNYLFATFDTDRTLDFSSADNAAFVVLSDHDGVKMKGNLTVSGTITANGQAVILNDDSRLSNARPASDVYAWAKASTKPSYSFSEISSRGEAFLSWGGQSLVANFGPIDAALVSQLGANRVAGIDGSYITIEKSNDGGSTWATVSTSNFSNWDRKSLFTTSSGIGLKYGSVNKTTDRLRITMDATSGGIYTAINKIMMYVSTSGSTGCSVHIDTAFYNSPTVWHNVGDFSLAGWSGWNVINTSLPGTGALGGSNYGEHNRFIRFTFSCTGVDSTYTDGLYIMKIYMFGGVGWSTPSTLAANGVPYSYDADGNMFCASIYENGTALSSKYAAKSHTHTKSEITDFPTSMPASDVYDWAKASTKPSYNFGEISAGNVNMGESSYFLYRSHETYRGGFYYSTPSAEALVFAHKYKYASWIFANELDPVSRSDWQGLSENTCMQIKNKCVAINKFWGPNDSPEYNLDVNGTINATTIYQNGSTLADTYLGKSAKAADSNKLNGQEASYYATLTGDQNITGTKTFINQIKFKTSANSTNEQLTISLVDLGSGIGYSKLLFDGCSYLEFHNMQVSLNFLSLYTLMGNYQTVYGSSIECLSLGNSEGSGINLISPYNSDGAISFRTNNSDSGITQYKLKVPSTVGYTEDRTIATTKDLEGYVAKNSAITGATKCKITYDSKGLVTSGADLAASDIPDLSGTYATKTFAQGLMTPTAVGQGLTKSNVNGYNGATFTIGTSGYGGLYIFTYGNCMILLPIYGLTANTEYKVAASLVNSGGSYSCKVLTYRYVSSSGTLQIYQKENYIPTGYGCALFKVKLY